MPKTFNLKYPFKFAVATISDLPHVLVRITSDTGVVGYGECPVWWDPFGETQSSTLDAIWKVAPHMIGRDPTAIDELMIACDAMIYGDYAAKCGLDMALFDLIESPYPFDLGVKKGQIIVKAGYPGLGYPPESELFLAREFD